MFRKILSLFVLVSLSVSMDILPVRAAVSIDQTASRVSVSKNVLKADGIDNAVVTVTAKDMNLAAMEGQKVTLVSSRGALDDIRVMSGTTDILGKASFRIFSLKDGISTYTATVAGTVLQPTVSITFSGGLTLALKTGDLIKIPDDSDAKTLNDTAVYYYASNGKRYVFPNEKTYFTWYQDFANVQIIPLDQMSLIPIGGNVTYRPGTRMVKFQTDSKTYIVTRGGILRWAKTEAVAKGWFGENWNTFIDDVSEAFYVNYTFGNPVENTLDLALDVVRDATKTIDVDKGLTKGY